MKDLLPVIFTGLGATAVMDLYAWVRRRLFGVALPNYALVGRWIAHLAEGTIRHASIARAQPRRFERAIGWTAHYGIGIGFAGILALAAGPDWFRGPTLLPALLVGIATVAAPFLIMQPAMGAGVAASRTPNPRAARFQSLATHAVFGLGLYLAALGYNLAFIQPTMSPSTASLPMSLSRSW